MTDEYTPSMNDVRSAYAMLPNGRDISPHLHGRGAGVLTWEEIRSAGYRRFDRWLAAYTVEVQANTLQDAADRGGFTTPDGSTYTIRCASTQYRARADSLHPVTPETKEEL